MRNSTPDVIEDLNLYERNAKVIGAISAVVAIIISVVRFFTSNQYVGPSLVAVAAIIITVAAILNFRGRYIYGTRLFLGTLMILVLSLALLVEGPGIYLAIIGIAMGSGLVLLTRPQHLAVRWIIVLVIVAEMTIFIDLFGPPGRFELSNPQIINYIVIGIVIIYGFFILRQFTNFSLRSKLISTTVIVAVVAVVSVTFIVTVTTRTALVAEVGDNIHNVANAQALAIGELLSRQVGILEALGLNRAVTDAVEAHNNTYGEGASEEEIQATIQQLEDEWHNASSTDRIVFSILNNSTSNELVNFRRSFPDHTQMILTDQYGALVASTTRVDDFYYGGEQWWQDTYLNGFGSKFVGEPNYDLETDNILIDVAVPVRATTSSGRNVFAGVLHSTYNIDAALTNVLDQAQFGESGEVELLVSDNIELHRFEDEATGNSKYELIPVETDEINILSDLGISGETYTIDQIHGTDNFITQQPVNTLSHEPRIDNLGWQIVAFQSESEALKSVKDQQQTNIFLGSIIIIIVTITAAVVAQLLTRPIIRLTDTAVRVSEGDLAARAPVETTDEIGTLAITFNQMTNQLQGSIEGLEQRVDERTRALTASVEVSRSLSTILDPSELVIEVVEQVRTAFSYYHAHIFLFSEDRHFLEIVGGTGEAGQIMLSRKHTLPAGQGLVGQAALHNKPVFIPDVSQSPDWKSNPLLPDTKAEIAVPIAIGEQVLGVLDVQHDVTGGLTDEDVQLLQAISYQVAIALQNAQSFDRARKQAEREATLNAINQRILKATSVDAVLKIATEELGRALGGQKNRIELVNPSRATEGNGHGA
ncbi:MAG: GAF domain-containing protein [Chloroflexi bacterium]|nr:GAF domain-containing protein [Chloroflexota bacterium]